MGNNQRPAHEYGGVLLAQKLLWGERWGVRERGREGKNHLKMWRTKTREKRGRAGNLNGRRA